MILTSLYKCASCSALQTFADRALGSVAVVMPIMVALSCMGAVNGDFLSNSRYMYSD